MSKVWKGKSYDTDFYEVDARGNRLSDQKDWEASAGWTAENEPWRDSPGWYAQPLTPDQAAGMKAADPAGWAKRETWLASNPTNAIGGPLGGGSWRTQQSRIGQVQVGDPSAGRGDIPLPNVNFDWSGWSGGGRQTPGRDNPIFFKPTPIVDYAGGLIGYQDGSGVSPAQLPSRFPDAPPWAWFNAPTLPPVSGGGPSSGPLGLPPQVLPVTPGAPVSTPQMNATALLSQLGGAPQMTTPSPLGTLGAAPTVASAGPLSAFGSAVQDSVTRDLAEPSVNTSDPAYRAQIDAFRRNEQRSADRQRLAAAQRANASGTLQSGGFDARVGQIAEQQGAREADFEAALMAAELSAARDRTARAQSLGAGLLSQEAQRALAERLANQSAAVTGLGYQNTRDLSNQSQALQAGLANQGAALQALGLQNTRDLANQSAGQQTGLANQAAALQTAALNSSRDLAAMQAGLQAQLANQGAGLTMRGQDLSRYGIDTNTALQQRDLDLKRYGIDTESALRRYGIDTTAGLQGRELDLRRYGIDTEAALQRLGIDTTAATTRRGQDVQRDLGINDALLRRNALELQKQLGLSDLDLRRLGLTNQDAQFYASLGQQLGLDSARLNQDALLALLRG